MGQQEAMPGLVDRLASTNAPAVITPIKGHPDLSSARFLQYDVNEGDRVKAAIDEVVRQTEDLWSELIAHLGDDRYCKTVGIDQMYPRNWSVGETCQHIIGWTLAEAYYRHMPGTKENYYRFNLPAFAQDRAELREWCLARKDKKLYELQIEACEWAIAEIEERYMFPSQRPQLIADIKEEIEGLKESQTAIECQSRL